MSMPDQTEGEDKYAMPKRDVAQDRAVLAARLDASLHGQLQVHAARITSIRRLELEILKEKHLIQAEEVDDLLQQENRKYAKVISELRSRAVQGMELQGAEYERKCVIGKLSQEVNSLRSLRDDIGDNLLGVTARRLCCEKNAVQEVLCKCQTQRESPEEHLKVETSDCDRDDNSVALDGDLKLEQKVNIATGELCKGGAFQHGTQVDCLQTTFLVESAAQEMLDCIATFCTSLSMYKSPDGQNTYFTTVLQHDLWKRTGEEPDNHWTYVLKHFICLRLLENFHSETFGSYQGEIHFLAQADRVKRCWDEYFMCWKHKGKLQVPISQAQEDQLDSLFFKYMASRFSALLPSELRFLCEVFQNQDKLIGALLCEKLSCLALENQTLVQSFIIAIEKVWQFHKLCLSFEPPVTLFRVQHGGPFNQDYMESFNELEQDDGTSLHKVGPTRLNAFTWLQDVP